MMISTSFQARKLSASTHLKHPHIGEMHVSMITPTGQWCNTDRSNINIRLMGGQRMAASSRPDIAEQ
jgi:hypothetical protein